MALRMSIKVLSLLILAYVLATLIPISVKFLPSNPSLAFLLVYVGLVGSLTSIISAVIVSIRDARSRRRSGAILKVPSFWEIIWINKDARRAYIIGVSSYILGIIIAIIIMYYFYYYFNVFLRYLLTANNLFIITGVWLLMSASYATLTYVLMMVFSIVIVRVFRVSMEPLVIDNDGFFGMTLIFPGVGRKVVVVGRGEYVKYVMTHEEAHAESRASSLLPFLIILVVLLYVLSEVILLWSRYYHTTYPMMLTLQPFFGFFVLGVLSFMFVFLRVLEVHADFAVYRRFGSSAVELLTMIERALRERPLIARLWSRLTHTGRRDFALRFGDPIGAHGTWDFAVPSSLFSAAFIYGFLIEVLGRLHNTLSVGLLVPIALVFWGSSLVVIFLLSLILRPIVFRLTRGFTDGGVSALSSLIASVYMASVGVALFLLPVAGLLSLTSLIVGALLNYALVRHYLSLVHGGSALKLILASYAVFMAINALLFVARVVLLHAYLP